jgi:hypothetical protein
VEPNCLCQGALASNPNQEFTARPAAGRAFPAALPLGVRLYFGSRVSTIELNPTFWRGEPHPREEHEIRFLLPADSRSGFVYLRALAPRPSHESAALARACGKIAPDLPHEILLDRAPAAQLSIVYPPVIDMITGSGQSNPPFEFEACTDVAICWQAHLQGERGVPLPPCGGIQVELRDGDGQVVGNGNHAACVPVNRPDNHTYTLEATSLAGPAGCGASNQETVTITRFRAVHLEWSQPQPNSANPVGAPILAGSEGSVTVRVSCPAGPDGIQVVLNSDNPQALQVNSPVIIAEGQTSVQSRIVALEECEAATVTATANDHRSIGSLTFDVHVQPVLQWATNAPDLRVGDTIPVEINTSCVPDNPAVEWWQVEVDAGGARLPNGRQIRLAQPVRIASQRFGVQLQGAAIGNWHLVVQIPFRNGIQSQDLAFTVGAQPTFTAAVIPPTRELEWGQAAVYEVQVQGQNLAAQALDVTLSVADLPSGAQAEFRDGQNQLSPLVSLTQQAPLQARVLNITTAHAATALGSGTLKVKATSSKPPTQREQEVNLVVRRSAGPFARANVIRPTNASIPFSQPCGNLVRAEAASVSLNDIRVTCFTSITGREERTQAIPAVAFVLSRNCRVGIALGGAPSFPVSWYNLGFMAAPVAIARLVTAWPPGTQSSNWRQFWFSPDDSLLVLIEDDASGNPPVTRNFTARLFDCTRNHQFDHRGFAARYDVASDGPEVLPVPTPRIRSIVLEPAGAAVTLTYEVHFNGKPDTKTLRLR